MVRKDSDLEEGDRDAVNIMDWIYRQGFAHHPSRRQKENIARELCPKSNVFPIRSNVTVDQKLAHDLAVMDCPRRHYKQVNYPTTVPVGPAAKPKQSVTSVQKETHEQTREYTYLGSFTRSDLFLYVLRIWLGRQRNLSIHKPKAFTKPFV